VASASAQLLDATLAGDPAPTDPPAIDLRGVSVHFMSERREVVALENISFSLRPGSFLTLLGPSGCGKSTLLRVVADILPPTSGSVRVLGHAPVEARRKREIGFVFQDSTLLPWRSALDNVRLPLQVGGGQSVRGSRTPEELLALVGLSGWERSLPHELSGGMRQRVSICRALLHSPPLLAMDEPFGALDALTRDQLQVDLLRLWTDQKMTVVFITHSISEAVFLSDRIVVMSPRPGRIETIIDVELERPRRLAVRDTPQYARYVHQVTDIFKSLGVLKEDEA
jgi:NitT/TauT family transport system ATP-binding protein